MNRTRTTTALLTSGLLLALGCKGATDADATKTGPVSFEMKRNPHGGNGLGTGGHMTDDWIYPKPEEGAAKPHAAPGAHGTSHESVGSPSDIPHADPGHGP